MSGPFEADGTVASLRRVVAPGGAVSLLAEFSARLPWLGAGSFGVTIQRVGTTTNGFAVDLDITSHQSAGPRSQHVIVEIRGDDVVSAADQINGRLRKRRRRQLRSTDVAVIAIPERSIVVRRAGYDERIVGLELLAHPRRARGLGADTGHLKTELLSHRLGKRATFRIDGKRRSVVVKAYKERSSIPAQVVEWTRVLHDAGLRVAEIAHADLQTSIVVMEDLVGEPEGCSLAEIVEPLRQFHDVVHRPARIHDPATELQILESAVALVRLAATPHVVYLDRALLQVARKLRGLSSSSPTLIHRDAHLGQFVKRSGRVWILDLDTVTTGDPMIDVGNVAAWCDVVADISGGDQFAEWYGVDTTQMERFAAWRAAAGLRLACQAILSAGMRPEVEHLIQRLMM